ncbi:N-acetylmuramoyl-L-alanine amidase [Candidatus Aerophobetes bacterium]|nr:N-acetylmuramoyl-L-alanine amidase [Candidatus Aerophobetes bacterium]
MKKIGLVLVLILFAQASQAYQNYSIGKIDVHSQSSRTQIILKLSQGTGYVVKDLVNPPRILLNLYPANLTPPKREVKIEDKFVKQVRLERDSRNVVKVVVDLAKDKCVYDVFLLKDPYRLVIDIRKPEEDIIAGLLKRETEEGKQLPHPSSVLPPPKKAGIQRIILDPGHGGKDPGAIGPSGLKEKDVTLAIAKGLSALLKRNLRVEVFLTREDDEFVSLDRRIEIANQLEGDIFVSIHANASWNYVAKGTETFFNSRYIYGEGAREVAIRENSVAEAEKIPEGAKDILLDLIQNQYRNESNKLAHLVQRELCHSCGLIDRGVKSARFYVLRGAKMPAILVEVGFISNPWEEKKLRKNNFQLLIAKGIYQGLAKYIKSFNKK